MRAWIVAPMASVFCAHVLAQPPLSSATPADLIEKLQQPPAVTRGMRNLKPEPRSVDLDVHFDFDSAALSPTSRTLLSNLALAMNSAPLEAVSFRLEGHTDAKGSDVYNQALSSRRAQAVMSFLVEHGVDSSRLSTEGMAARNLLLPDQPFAAVNRRVRVIALHGSQE